MANRDRFIVLVEEPEPHFVHGGQSVADVAQDVVAQVNQVLMLGLVLKLSNIQNIYLVYSLNACSCQDNEIFLKIDICRGIYYAKYYGGRGVRITTGEKMKKRQRKREKITLKRTDMPYCNASRVIG